MLDIAIVFIWLSLQYDDFLLVLGCSAGDPRVSHINHDLSISV